MKEEKSNRLSLRVAALSLFFLVPTLFATFAKAQENFPTGPITIVVPYEAGSHPDELIRVVKSGVEKRLGQKLIIENRGGGSGVVGTKVGFSAKPNGYTLTWHTSTSAVLNQFTKKNFDIELSKMVPITQAAYWPAAIIISSKLPVNSISELVDLLKKNPGKYKYNISGLGTMGHILSALFMVRTGTNMIMVPYSSGTDAALSMLTGETSLNVGGADAIVDGIKALCVASDAPAPSLPGVPTCGEAGVSNFKLGNWAGLFAPPGTPQEIVDKIAPAFEAALKDPDVVKAYAASGDTAVGSSPADFDKFWKDQFASWKNVIETVGYKP